MQGDCERVYVNDQCQCVCNGGEVDPEDHFIPIEFKGVHSLTDVELSEEEWVEYAESVGVSVNPPVQSNLWQGSSSGTVKYAVPNLGDKNGKTEMCTGCKTTCNVGLATRMLDDLGSAWFCKNCVELLTKKEPTPDMVKRNMPGSKILDKEKTTTNFGHYESSCPSHLEKIPVLNGHMIVGGSRFKEAKIHPDADVCLFLDTSWERFANPIVQNITPGDNGIEIPIFQSTTKAPIAFIKWPDMGTPGAAIFPYAEWIASLLKDGKNVQTGCIGGHGRTGTLLAVVLLAAGVEEYAYDAIRFVRKKYCEFAIESISQEQFIYAYSGEQYPTVELKKKGYIPLSKEHLFDTETHKVVAMPGQGYVASEVHEEGEVFKESDSKIGGPEDGEGETESGESSETTSDGVIDEEELSEGDAAILAAIIAQEEADYYG